MNKTKKLTQGAMLLAIIGALMMIDRQLSYFLSTYILLIIPVVIIIYSVMYTNKDGLILCVGLGVFTILFGDLNTYLYMPLSIIVGVGLSVCINKGMDKGKVALVGAILYMIGEVVITFVLSPLLGIDFLETITSMKDMLVTYGLSDQLSSFSIDIDKMLMVLFCFSVLLTGVLEGYLTSIITTLLLKRLKIKDIGARAVIDKVLNPVVAYICMALTFGLYFERMLLTSSKYQTLGCVLLCVSITAAMILAFYGYYYVISYYKYTLGKKIVFLVVVAFIFLTAYVLIILVIVGFLYGAGPLRNKLVEKRILETQINNEKQK